MPLRTPSFPGLFHIGIKIHSDVVYIYRYEYLIPALVESPASPVHVDCSRDLLQSGQGTDLELSYVKVLLNSFYNTA